MDINEKSMDCHRKWAGKISVIVTAPAATCDDLSVAYTPGVAAPCLAIQKDESLSYELTRRHNLVAVITDGSAVLGLGDIGPVAGMPVMEGKCLLFKEFADVDAFPLCVGTKDVDEFVRTVALLQGSFGGINLEDISAPRCFEIEQKLKKICDIPVFHDDQHGTAVVVSAALKNALKLTNRTLGECKIVINGAGAAGTAIGLLLKSYGAKNIIFVASRGAICRGTEYKNDNHRRLAEEFNPMGSTGTLAEVIRDADVFIGVSKPGLLNGEMVRSMNNNPIIFALANPVPEIMPDEAIAAGAAVVGSGRSDFPNQINNLLAFPGIFRGALDCRASEINEAMKIAAAEAIASLVTEDELANGVILPSPLDKRVAAVCAAAVADAARASGVARI